jgi:hypothetical protein
MWSIYIGKFSPFWNTILPDFPEIKCKHFLPSSLRENYLLRNICGTFICNLLVCISEKLHEYNSEIFNILHAVCTRYDFVSETANAFIKQTPAILRAIFRIKTENLRAERDRSSNIEWIYAEL